MFIIIMVIRNVLGWDMDIRQSPLVRIMPQAPYQLVPPLSYLYMPFLYFFYTIHVSYYRDFYDFIQ
jgi:linoleoyl-CoA desaturase